MFYMHLNLPVFTEVMMSFVREIQAQNIISLCNIPMYQAE